jgi:putative ABC transport system ATP-binding protein
MEKGTNYIIQLINVTKSYNGSGQGPVALRDVSFAAQTGEMVLLLGPSGSGKTTFLTLMAGLQPATSGEVYLFGKHINEYSTGELQKIRAKRMGFIFQNFNLINSLTVIQNITMVLHYGGSDRKTANKTAMDYLRNLGIEKLSDSLPAKVSHGEKQRAAIARALVNGAELIIADEPTGSLSSSQGMEIIELLQKSCKDESRCVIVASHDERIIKLADRVLYLNDGELKSE